MPFTVPTNTAEAIAALRDLRHREAAMQQLWESKRTIDYRCKAESHEIDCLKHTLLDYAKANGGEMLVLLDGGVVADVRPPVAGMFATSGVIAFRPIVTEGAL